jgi:glycosyltransferase involved in cell wall biosynthesis
VVPHGNYAGVHPISVTRADARARLDIPLDAFVYLLLGNISLYKGIETAVGNVQRQPDSSSIVLIAGRNRAPDLVSHLEDLSATDPRIRLFPGFIPDDQMQYYLMAADVMVCSFRQILSSGSVILGMSYGLPIIAPRMGCLPELVTPMAGILYDPADSTALAYALTEIKRADTEAMGRAAKAIADTLQWDGIARRTADIYQSCLEGSL